MNPIPRKRIETTPQPSMPVHHASQATITIRVTPAPPSNQLVHHNQNSDRITRLMLIKQQIADGSYDETRNIDDALDQLLADLVD